MNAPMSLKGMRPLPIDRYSQPYNTGGVILSTAFGLLGAVLNPGLGFGLSLFNRHSLHGRIY
jgi:hypothetical protein